LAKESLQVGPSYNHETGDIVRYVIVLLALAGVVVSGLALKVHYDTGSEPCSINDKWDCGVVNHSPYAVFHGVPVAAVGIAGYLLISVLGFLGRPGWLLLPVLVGLAFSLYLTNIEARVLEVWCLYCVVSQAIIAVLTILTLVWGGWGRFRGARSWQTPQS
jgi:vitamin-K-epoxide reductase (warfarin-sensitive)